MENLHQTELGFLSLVYLGGFQIFFIELNTGSWWRTIFKERWISKFDTIFEKYSLKVFTSCLSSDNTFSFKINIILSYFKVLSVRHGYTVFQNCLLSVTHLTSRLLKKPFLVFRKNLIQIFCCFLYATCDNMVLSCLRWFP